MFRWSTRLVLIVVYVRSIGKVAIVLILISTLAVNRPCAQATVVALVVSPGAFGGCSIAAIPSVVSGSHACVLGVQLGLEQREKNYVPRMIY